MASTAEIIDTTTGQNIFENVNRSERESFRAEIGKLQRQTEKYAGRAEITEDQFKRIGNQIIETSDAAARLINKLRGNKVAEADIKNVMLFMRDQVKQRLQVLNDTELKSDDPDLSNVPLYDLAIHRYFEARTRFQAQVLKPGVSTSETLPILMELSASDTARLSSFFNEDVKSIKAAHPELIVTEPTGVILGAEEVKGIKALPGRKFDWVTTTILQNARKAVTYYDGNPPQKLETDFEKQLKELSSGLRTYEIGGAKGGKPTLARSRDIRTEIDNILRENNKLKDPIFEGWKRSIYDIKVNGMSLDTYLKDLKLRIAKAGQADFDRTTYILSELDVRKTYLAQGIRYDDPDLSGYNEWLQEQKEKFLDDLEKEVTELRSKIEPNVANKGAYGVGEGRQPSPEGTILDWKKFYREIDDPTFFKQEAAELIDALLSSNQRSVAVSGGENKIYARMRGLSDILSDAKNPDGSPRKEYNDIGRFMENRRLLYDMALVHGQSRSMTADMDKLAGEAGMGFNEKVLDYFFEGKRDANGELIDFEHHEQVLEGFTIIERLLFDEDSEFSGGKFKEDEFHRDKIKVKIKEELESVYGVGNVSKETVQITYEIATVISMRLHFFTDFYAFGSSPAGNIAVLKRYIEESNPMAAGMYKAYKRRRYTPIFEIFKMPRTWWRRVKGRTDTIPDRIKNIEESEKGTLLYLEQFAPLRERQEAHTQENLSGRETLRNAYPSMYDFIVVRADERRKKHISIEQWVSGKTAFVNFEHAVMAPFKKPPDGKVEGKWFGKAREVREAYRSTLMEQFDVILNTHISALKTNDMVDWTDVAELTLRFIDRMFRAYAQLDQGSIGRQLLHNRILRKINGEGIGLDSAGTKLPGELTQKINVYPYSDDPHKSVRMTFREFLRSRIRYKDSPGQEFRERPLIDKELGKDNPGSRGITRTAQYNAFEAWAKLEGNQEFKSTARPLGETVAEKQKDVDDDKHH